MWRRMAWAAGLAVAWASGACGRGETGSEMAKSAPGSSANTVVVPADSPQLQQIKVEAVQIAEVASEELVAPARVIANPNRTARVLSPVQGRVTGVLVRLGDRRRQGQPVVTPQGPAPEAAGAPVPPAHAPRAPAAPPPHTSAAP